MNQNNQTLQKKRIAITASSISCAYGELPAALFGGVATNLSCRTAVPNLKLRTFDNQMEQPFWAPYESIFGKFHQRSAHPAVTARMRCKNFLSFKSAKKP